jgi:hypothetical protein
MPYDNEYVAVTLLAALQADMRAALDAVEATWTSRGDPITLPSPVTWHRGANPVILELESDDFPYVSVLVPARTPVDGSGSDQPGLGEQTIQVWVEFLLVDEVIATVNSMSHRYAEALTALLRTNHNLRGYEMANEEPEVNQSIVYEHGDTVESDMQRPAQVRYMQGARIIADFQGM